MIRITFSKSLTVRNRSCFYEQHQYSRFLQFSFGNPAETDNLSLPFIRLSVVSGFRLNFINSVYKSYIFPIYIDMFYIRNIYDLYMDYIRTNKE